MRDSRRVRSDVRNRRILRRNRRPLHLHSRLHRRNSPLPDRRPVPARPPSGRSFRSRPRPSPSTSTESAASNPCRSSKDCTSAPPIARRAVRSAISRRIESAGRASASSGWPPERAGLARRRRIDRPERRHRTRGGGVARRGRGGGHRAGGRSRVRGGVGACATCGTAGCGAPGER